MIKVGIIGLGRMGNTHAPLLQNNPDAQVAFIYDINPAQAAAAKEKYGAEICASLEELCTKADAIFITSPTYCHIEALRVAMGTGKPVFCEKPLVRTPEQCAEVEKLAAASKSKVAVGFVRRFQPAQAKFRDLVAAGELGTLRAANIDLTVGAFKRMPGDWFADFELCGGVLLDMLAHHIDQLLWTFGDVSSVYANGLLESKELPLPADYCSATINFRNGVICNVTCGWQRAGRNANYMDAYGDKGYASYIWGQNEVTVQMVGGESKKIEVPLPAPVFQLEDNSWIASIVNNTQPMVTLQDGIKAFKVAMAMIESVKTQQVIKL